MCKVLHAFPKPKAVSMYTVSELITISVNKNLTWRW